MARQRMNYACSMPVDARRRGGRDSSRASEAEPDLGAILRRARQRRGFTLRGVEDRTSIPNAHLSQIERGQIRRPDQRILWKLAQLYELNFGLLAVWAGSSEEITDERAAYLDAVVRFLRDLGEDDLKKVMLYVEGLAQSGEIDRDRAKPRAPRLGTGRSSDGAGARELAGKPVAREPK